jgi:hypothetical protein
MFLWDVRAHLAGHVTRKALLCLEDALGPFVKARVKEHFPETDSVKAKRLEERASAGEHRKVRLFQLQADLVALEKDMQRETGLGKKKMGARKGKMLAEQRKLEVAAKSDVKNAEEERHSVECR